MLGRITHLIPGLIYNINAFRDKEIKLREGHRV